MKPLALGIIGHPIGHTLSPRMHLMAAKYNDIALSYSAYDVSPKSLARAIDGVRALSIDGLNVTVPYKVEVMGLLDEISGTARTIGAVNTIVRKGEILKGYNTDAEGFIKSVRKNGLTDPYGKSVFVYGAGGAAKAVVTALASAGVRKITVTNRTEARSVELAVSAVQTASTADVDVALYDSNKLFESVSSADIIVNTTSVGMGASGGSLPGLEGLHAGQLVVDIVYAPLKTDLLKRAEEAGARPLDGLWMLIYQGAEAFRLWTGKPFPIDKVRNAITAELEP